MSQDNTIRFNKYDRIGEYFIHPFKVDYINKKNSRNDSVSEQLNFSEKICRTIVNIIIKSGTLTVSYRDSR